MQGQSDEHDKVFLLFLSHDTMTNGSVDNAGSNWKSTEMLRLLTIADSLSLQHTANFSCFDHEANHPLLIPFTSSKLTSFVFHLFGTYPESVD